MASDRQAISEYLKAFQARMERAREAAGLDKTKMAKALRVPQTRYAKWETRASFQMPSFYHEQFCLICRVELRWLVTGKGKGPVAKPIRVAG
jgi:hypothetical protein